MAAPSVAPSIDRKSSIEAEPLTLDIRQINFAREAALYVMSTKTLEEALQIFTEGLEPAVSPAPSIGGHSDGIPVEIAGDDLDSDSDEEDEEEEYTLYATSDNKRQFGVEKLRDVYSAPF